MTTFAMSSYMALCNNELVNASRTSTYIENGIKPPGYEFKCDGCDGLTDILPDCEDDPHTPDDGAYSLPETDTAPWYDPAVPESANFAGLYVIDVTISSPYSRTVTNNIGDGGTLGRLKLLPRTIVVRGFLVGKTCCATGYGLKWLQDVLTDPPCQGGGCGGCDLDFLECCPRIGPGADDCLTVVDSNGVRSTFVRQDADDEYARASDFFRTMHDVGIVSGPEILSCRGGSCGCGCPGSLLEVEFTLAAGSPYVNGEPEDLVRDRMPTRCPATDPNDPDCDITWSPGKGACPPDADCPQGVDCADDPQCAPAILPPQPRGGLGKGCGCYPLRTSRECVSAPATKQWGSSTFNFEIYAGSEPMRNVAIRLFQNPLGRDCASEEHFPDCDACSTLLISYIPANGTMYFSGETRTVEIECNKIRKSGFSSVTDIDGQAFDWPDVTCVPVCICFTFDCDNTAADATYSVERVDRSL